MNKPIVGKVLRQLRDGRGWTLEDGLDPTVVSPGAIWRQSMGNLASMSSSKRP
jgi:hypothetical protein